MAWNAGYMTSIDYTFGYYPELSPVRANAAVLNAGRYPPVVRNACELGFGQGLSTLIHAAAQPDVQWWGTDFNPAQAAFAREVASSGGLNANLYDQAFDEFCTRDDLPEFEFIGLHGIWTWISDENREVIVDFVRRKLALGGVLYISYNTLPGWAATSPIRHLLKEYDKRCAAAGMPVAERLDAAIGFVDSLIAADAAYTRNYPLVAERFEGVKKHTKNYLAHEYLNEHWDPMYFSEMFERLGEAKVSYVGSANMLEQQDAASLTPAQSAQLGKFTDVAIRETARDFMVGQQFRRDIWMRGPRALAPLEHAEVLRKQGYLLVMPRAEVPLTVKGIQGDISLQENVYNPLLDCLADHKVKTFADLERVGYAASLNLAQTANAVGILLGMGAIAPAQNDPTISRARKSTDRLNEAVFERARFNGEVNYLASPVTGGGIAVGRIDQLFLLARARGKKVPAEWAAFVWAVFEAQGQKIVKEGRAIETPEDNLKELIGLAERFEAKSLPLLKSLGIA